MKKKNKIIAIGALITFLIYHGIDYQYNPNYEIIEENDEAFGRYSKGRIYIGDEEYLESLKDVNENDILVLDKRFNDNPFMKVYDSNIINNKEIRNEILEVLCRYEECYPSPWDRSIESMRVEWLMHNLSYFFDYESHRTRDVDLDNNDEHYYDNILLRKILKL